MQDIRPLPRPLVCDPATPGALPLAGGPLRFALVETAGAVAPADTLAPGLLAALTAPRPALCGLDLASPRVMGILNVTPDSFSDGGRNFGVARALARARDMVAAGVDIIDIGGESTRPGSATVPDAEEIARVVPAIEAIRAAGIATPISVDTRKPAVFRAAHAAGGDLWNDVTALTHAPDSLALAAECDAPVCLMHSRGTPETMTGLTDYADVLGEVVDWLGARAEACIAAGIRPGHILLDPGIGFAKTAAQNLALIRGLAAFHALGYPLLLGVSRKRFIGTIGGAEAAADRFPGSIAAGLAGLAQGAQVLRVHDVEDTIQAVRLWRATTTGETS
ncbi:dihydropteroate synthase [Paroceanicella profunda]|uniref:Dihydropteroate synthase n=1 Tax=Paroceanicella profunda TaxID=2579971 RepID=A0A5B8G0Y8_9RHOB|nr:dihydropteroate synthase [Paroceanicella profunda]QDL92819.1 dihydropteroate synthase [Paroceanicella profunda]